MTTPLRALPAEGVRLQPDEWSQPFWDALGQGHLTVGRCAACNEPRMPPLPRCPVCGSREMTWCEGSSTGTIYSFTVVHRAVLPELHDHVPYAVVLVSMDEPEVRLIGNLVHADAEEVAIGAGVRFVGDPSRYGPRVVFELERTDGGGR